MAPGTWRGGLAATGGAALLATIVASLAGSAPSFTAPATLVARIAAEAVGPWTMGTPGNALPAMALLRSAVLYLAVGTIAGWLARGNCLICRTITAVLGLGGYWWYAGSTAPVAAAILAFGPLPIALRPSAAPPQSGLWLFRLVSHQNRLRNTF